MGPEAIPVIAQLARQVARVNVYRRSHPRRASRLAAEMGRALGLSPAQCEIARLSALLKDIGILDVPSSILDRPGPIHAWEAETIDRHREFAAEMIAPYVGAEVAAVVARHRGAPAEAGVEPTGESGIVTIASLVAAVDAYDALASDRAYRVGRCKRDSLAELQAASGTELDPAAVETLIGVKRGRHARAWSPALSPVAALLRRAEHLRHVSAEPGAAAVSALVLGAAVWLGLSWAAAIQVGLRP